MVHACLNTTINAGDAEAADIHYHTSCYMRMKNAARSRSSSNATGKTIDEQAYDPLVIAQLVAFMQCKNSPHKLSDLKKLYDQ